MCHFGGENGQHFEGSCLEEVALGLKRVSFALVHLTNNRKIYLTMNMINGQHVLLDHMQPSKSD